MSQGYEPKASSALIGCEECGLVVPLPDLVEDQKATCPRCHHTLMKRVVQPFQRPIAYGVACLIMLLLSICFPFMSFSFNGLSQHITLLHAAEMMQYFKYGELALLLVATVLILPTCYVVSVIYLYVLAGKFQKLRAQGEDPLANRPHWSWTCLLFRTTFRLQPWLMVDVFLIGVLVSMVKIASLAHVGLGNSFWAFCAYTVFLIKTIAMTDKVWLWKQLVPFVSVQGVKAGDTHLCHNHVDCHLCGQLHEMTDEKHMKCARCGAGLHGYEPQRSTQKSWALLITAIVFYIPANLFPMMYTVSLGDSQGSTIMGGVVLLWKMGSYPVAAVIFFASIAIPLAKMLAIAWMLFRAQTVKQSTDHASMARLKLYRMTELVGRWSMVDIFVVALLVALVQLQNIMAISPGPAALCFAIVVISTMFSAMFFDPRQFWCMPFQPSLETETKESVITASSHNEKVKL